MRARVWVRAWVRVRMRAIIRVRHGLDRRVSILLEQPPLDLGERRDHALVTAEGGPALVLCLPAVLNELGQAGGGRVPPVAAVEQLGTDALSG